MKDTHLKEKIILLHTEGKTISEIRIILKCSKDKVLYYTDSAYREKTLEKKRAYKKSKRSYKKKSIIKIFGDKCQICFYDKCQKSLNFHHVDPSAKRFEISNALCKNAVPQEEIYEELKKCILVCANCHNEIHAEITKIPENVKNPLTGDENMVECLRSLGVVASVNAKVEEKAENPLTIDQIVVT